MGSDRLICSVLRPGYYRRTTMGKFCVYSRATSTTFKNNSKDYYELFARWIHNKPVGKTKKALTLMPQRLERQEIRRIDQMLNSVNGRELCLVNSPDRCMVWPRRSATHRFGATTFGYGRDPLSVLTLMIVISSITMELLALGFFFLEKRDLAQ